jgi:CelD/BcsL family acetyltransferase involved in cellulose biosynthesis
MAAVAVATGRRIRVLRTLGELDSVHDAWLGLRGDQLAVDPGFFAAAAASDPQIVRPHVVAVERGGEPETILAARIERLRLPLKLGYHTLAAPRVRALTVVAGGILGRGDERAFRELLASVQASLAAGEADVAIFRHLPLGGAYHHIASTTPSYACRQHVHDCELRWELDLPANFEDFLARLSRSRRKSIARGARRLEREYGDRLAVRRYTDPADLDEYFRAVEAVAVKTYQRALGVAFGDTPAHRARTLFCMERGWYRGYVLLLDGRPVAFEHGALYEGRFHSGRPGYDPALAHLGIGTFLFVRALEDLCADPEAAVFDYGFGDADYKRAFGSRCRREGSVVVYAPTVRAQSINLLRSTLLATTTAGKRAVGGETLHQLKRRWRLRLQQSRAA